MQSIDCDKSHFLARVINKKIINKKSVMEFHGTFFHGFIT